MDKVLKIHKLSKLTQEETKSEQLPITSKETDLVI